MSAAARATPVGSAYVVLVVTEVLTVGGAVPRDAGDKRGVPGEQPVSCRSPAPHPHRGGLGAGALGVVAQEHPPGPPVGGDPDAGLCGAAELLDRLADDPTP